MFLLGPSHHFYSKHCLLSPAEEYGTPLGEQGRPKLGCLCRDMHQPSYHAGWVSVH